MLAHNSPHLPFFIHTSHLLRMLYFHVLSDHLHRVEAVLSTYQIGHFIFFQKNARRNDPPRSQSSNVCHARNPPSASVEDASHHDQEMAECSPRHQGRRVQPLSSPTSQESQLRTTQPTCPPNSKNNAHYPSAWLLYHFRS